MSKKTLKELTIKDNFLFGAVMSDKKNCRMFLERVLEFPIERIVVDKEKSIFYNPEYKGIRLDVYAKDEKNTCYNVEMQALREAALPKRTRYYHSQMDMDLLLSRQDYEELSDAYVIFVCDFDPFGLGLYKYSFDNLCAERPEISHMDGTHTIYLSTKGTNAEEVPESLVRFLQYLSADLKDSTKDYEDPFVSQLQESVQKVKASREMEDKHMLMELLMRDQRRAGKAEGLAEGLAKGEAKGKAESVLEFLSDHSAINSELREQIMAEGDMDTLKRWVKLSAQVTSIEEFIEKM